MAKNQEVTRPGAPQRPVQSKGLAAKPGLVPSDPLPGWLAAVQVLILLGIPITLLLLARLVLHRFFPQLGY
jgi:hypothetical protein